MAIWIAAHESINEVKTLLNKVMDEAKVELGKIGKDGLSTIEKADAPEQLQDAQRAAAQLLGEASAKYQRTITDIAELVSTFAQSIETESMDRMQQITDKVEDILQGMQENA